MKKEKLLPLMSFTKETKGDCEREEISCMCRWGGCWWNNDIKFAYSIFEIVERNSGRKKNHACVLWRQMLTG